MLKPKFRAWDKVNHCWSHDFLYIDEDGDLYEIEERSQAYETYMYKKLVNDRYDVVWSTGIFSKSGIEIYEGNIVHVVNMLTTAPGTEPYDAVIEWDKYRWSMRRLGGIFTMTYLGSFPLNSLDTFGLDLEVIGSIHENPELIK